MVLATFNLPDELRERLKLEENQSELVTKLLLNYFSDIGASKLEEQIKLLENQRQLHDQTTNQRIEELKKRLEEKKNEEILKQAEILRAEKIKKMQEEAVTEV